MRATFVLGTFEPDAVRLGQPLSPRTVTWLNELSDRLGIEADVLFAVEDKIYAGRSKGDIKMDVIREHRPRVLDEIHVFRPDFVVCFGPVAAACVFGKGNLTEDALLRRRHEPFGPDQPPVYYTYSLENIRRAPGLAQFVELDVTAAVEGWPETQWGEYMVLKPGEWHWGICPLSPAPVIGFDTETYPGLNYYDREARIRMVQITDAVGEAYVVQLGPNSEMPVWLKNLAEDPAVLKTGSNIKYDAQWLRRFGVRLCNFQDTSTREHILDSNNPKTDLKSLTFLYLPRLGDYARPHKELVKQRAKENGVPADDGWRFVRDDEQYDYAAADAEASLAAYQAQQKKFDENPGLANMNRLMQDVYALLSDMEFEGVVINVPENRRLDTLYRDKLRALRQEIQGVLGPVNPNSTPKLAEALKQAVPTVNLSLYEWKRLVGPEEEEELSTCREVLEREAHKHPILKKVLEYRKYRARHSTFIKAIHDKHMVYHHGQHFLHPRYRTDLVETGRLSAQSPPMMGMPTSDYDNPELSIKRQFISRWPGGKILNVDQSQMELRFAAWLSQDPNLIAAIESGEDIHRSMAGILLGKPPEEVTKQERYECKARTFLILYGGGANKLVEQLLKSDVNPRRVSKKEAHSMIQDYFRKFSGLKRYIDSVHAAVQRDLSVTTAFGFTRRFADPGYWGGAEGFHIKRQAFNAMVQNPAACMTYCGMLAMQDALRNRNLQSLLVLQTHDSITLDVHPNELNLVPELAIEAMQHGSVQIAQLLGVDFALPLSVDAEMGDSWGTLESLTIGV